MKMIFIFILMVLLFAPTLIDLINTWGKNDDYSHGFFVLPISLYMVWQKRKKLGSLPVKPSWIGFPVFFGGLAAYSIGFVTQFHTCIYLSIVVSILGLLFSLCGLQITKELLLPVLFLFFMFPIPNAYYISITNPLKLMITKISTQVISIAGIPVYRDGNLLFFANSQLEVAEACSGVRSLYSYLMLGCVFALISKKRWCKVIIVLSTIPLAIFVNIVRVTVTGILSHYHGAEVADGFFHEFSGFILFALGLAILYWVYHLLNYKTAAQGR